VNEAHIRSDLQRANNQTGRQKNKAGCHLYLFPPPYIKCPTKSWLRFTGEPATGNAYAEWVQSIALAILGRAPL
jgi:hypothetical protein